jgi:hypothetical protein
MSRLMYPWRSRLVSIQNPAIAQPANYYYIWQEPGVKINNHEYGLQWTRGTKSHICKE